MRWASAKLPESGVSFSVHNEMAFPSPGIQYIHFPMLMTGRRDLSAKVGQYSSRTKDAFGRFCKRLFKVNNALLSGNLAVCNSLYIEGIYKEYYGTTSLTDVLYPPCIIPDNTRKPHSERDDSIVVIGRAVPHKRFEDAISIQKECRMKGVRLTLHIVSSGGDKDYLAFLKDLTSNHDDIVWHTHVTRIELASLLSTCKYGLHCMHGEHFGMATAEMAGAGCVVFGHDSGGTREILPFDSLRFGSLDDAVNKIVSVHKQSGTGADLSAKLLEHSKVFSHTEFGIRIRDIVGNFNFPA
jgi:glycosyltransferase involved in cell wall biosynthesis